MSSARAKRGMNTDRKEEPNMCGFTESEICRLFLICEWYFLDGKMRDLVDSIFKAKRINEFDNMVSLREEFNDLLNRESDLDPVPESVQTLFDRFIRCAEVKYPFLRVNNQAYSYRKMFPTWERGVNDLLTNPKFGHDKLFLDQLGEAKKCLDDADRAGNNQLFVHNIRSFLVSITKMKDPKGFPPNPNGFKEACRKTLTKHERDDAYFFALSVIHNN